MLCFDGEVHVTSVQWGVQWLCERRRLPLRSKGESLSVQARFQLRTEGKRNVPEID